MPNYPKITAKKIKYNSPSGYANIGKYIPPFENNDTGFGYKGVLIEDSVSGDIECSICGKWFQQLGKHLEKHGIDSKEYKKRFGLLYSTALKSKQMRIKQSEVMIKLRKENKSNRLKFKRNNEFAGNRKNQPKSLESQNKFGVCDLQMIDRIKELAKELGKTPTLIDLKERYGNGYITCLAKRYGSYIALCKQNGFIPNTSNFNPKYSREYFIKKAKEQKQPLFTINEGRALYRHRYCSKKYARIVQMFSRENMPKSVVRVYKHTDYLKHKEQYNQKAKEWALNNPEKRKEHKRIYYAKHKHRILTISRLKTKIFNAIRKSEYIHPICRTAVISELKEAVKNETK